MLSVSSFTVYSDKQLVFGGGRGGGNVGGDEDVWQLWKVFRSRKDNEEIRKCAVLISLPRLR